ncbi:15295_t:CDS:2, partial [Acaulospora morrowiae]
SVQLIQLSIKSFGNESKNDNGFFQIIGIQSEDFQPISPINCQPFVWDTETDEAHQMPEVEKWGGTDISIGASDNDCVWIETKKKKEDFKEGQAIGELFIVDKKSATNSMSVLTDCNDNWTIYFFMQTKNHQYLASSKINDRGITLAIIREFALDEGKFIHSEMGKLVTYQVNLPEPLKKKSRFLEPIPEEVDDRMADLIDAMTEKELFNMSMRRRLNIGKSIVRIEEQPVD